MPWDPTFKVIDQRPLAQNILNYIGTHQTAALSWANGGPGLDDFAQFYTNASGRLQTVFPCLMVLSQGLGTDLTGDQVQAAFEIVLEGAVSGPDPDALVEKTKGYAMAVESMVVNMPSDDLVINTNQYHKGFLVTMETVHDVVTRITSGFLQVFQVRLTFNIITSGV